MIAKAPRPRMTPEQFERLRDAKGFELLEGIVQEKNGGAENSAIQTHIGYFLTAAVLPSNGGVVIGTEGMYQCFPKRRKTVRKPDVSFILQERLPGGRVPIGICKFRPDLAVEVISPNDTYEEVDEKLADYFDAGIPLIWVVTPKTRTVLVYRADGTTQRLNGTDELTADPIIAGFRVKIADLFPNPPAPPADATTDPVLAPQ